MSWELVAIIVTVVIFAVFAIGAVPEWIDDRDTPLFPSKKQFKKDCAEIVKDMEKKLEEIPPRISGLDLLLNSLERFYGFTFSVGRDENGIVWVTVKRNGKSSGFRWGLANELGQGVEEIIQKALDDTEKKIPRKHASRRMVR